MALFVNNILITISDFNGIYNIIYAFFLQLLNLYDTIVLCVIQENLRLSLSLSLSLIFKRERNNNL